MNIDNKAWLTNYQVSFNCNSYLYHFTSVEKATLILDGNSLRFSKITNTNDTLESKPKFGLIGINSPEKVKTILNRIKEINNKYIQLLCFTTDSDVKLHTNSEKIKYNDYTGRGFSLPRMWAQYANNNDGVCFVFDKQKLFALVDRELGANQIKRDRINYSSQYDKDPTRFEYESLAFLEEAENELSKSIQYVTFIKDNTSYTNVNYFTKLEDWRTENEFRILAYGEDEFFIKNIKSALVGIIIGEQIKSNNEKIIKLFCKDVCEIKKITFTYEGCMLENIYDDDEEV